jgi:hypothetical protein
LPSLGSANKKHCYRVRNGSVSKVGVAPSLGSAKHIGLEEGTSLEPNLSILATREVSSKDEICGVEVRRSGIDNDA